MEKNIAYTPVGQVVKVKNKGFRKAGISQVSQGTHAIKTVFSITAAAEQKVGRAISARQIKTSPPELSLIKADLCHAE